MPVYASDSPETVLERAKTSYKQAIELQGAWTSTGKLIQNAEQAMKEGDHKTALQYATQAENEARASIVQAQDQLKNWSEPPYIRQ